jgi:hypothetical protein
LGCGFYRRIHSLGILWHSGATCLARCRWRQLAIGKVIAAITKETKPNGQ